ncbi:MAG: sigma-70 family RNA polymerase sigma factor [Clostridia bacterium]|nr:sigma-70 family RNA polymerase sigma factor [Clostridia bacterium]
MNRSDAEKRITEYARSIYGFALKRCKSPEDAEDLSQEIVMRAYRALLVRDDIHDIGKFIWTVAHNALNNYYRDSAKTYVGVPIDEVAEILADPDTAWEDANDLEAIRRLRVEIAYLSKTQRRIVIAYYFENKKQDDIAKALGLSPGTVKWHLFEARKDLKKGMNTMRESSELKFNPIQFSLCSSNGSVGTQASPTRNLHSSLAQNISYCVRKEAKTVNEIADDLGVSPVYVENEAEALEEHGLLLKQGNRYIINFLLDEGNPAVIARMDEMYEKTAEVFANELYDVLSDHPVLENVVCNRMVGIDEAKRHPIYKRDKNFILWALIPYVAALSGEAQLKKAVSFEEACTIRPDGGKNICYATVKGGTTPKYFDSMQSFCGPCWSGIDGEFALWTVDSEWSTRRVDDNYHITVARDLSLLRQFFADQEMSDYDCAYMAEQGYLYRYESDKGQWTGLQIAWIPDIETKRELIAIGNRIKEKHASLFESLRASYEKAALANTPKHLHKMRLYGLQRTYYMDGWFILHCLKTLVANGKLQLPKEEQKKFLSVLIAPND